MAWTRRGAGLSPQVAGGSRESGRRDHRIRRRARQVVVLLHVKGKSLWTGRSFESDIIHCFTAIPSLQTAILSPLKRQFHRENVVAQGVISPCGFEPRLDAPTLAAARIQSRLTRVQSGSDRLS